MKKIIVLLIFLLTAIVFFSSCGYGQSQEGRIYNSHAEFTSFIEKFNSKNDGSVNIFMSFDFDANEKANNKCYSWRMVAKRYPFDILGSDKIYDKYQKNSAQVRITLYLNDYSADGTIIEDAYQIFCAYSSHHGVENLYQNDEFRLIPLSDEDNYYRHYSISQDFYNPSNNSYKLLASYNLQTHETNVMEIYIAGLENEVSQEKLDEICQLLLDNLVIINTEER